MQITLDQTEIHEAVENYVRSQIALAPNQTVAIDFTAGRGEKGLTATLDIRTAAVVAASSKPVHRATVPASQSIGQGVIASGSTTKAAEEPAPEEEQAPAAISSGEERVDPADADEQGEAADPAPQPEKASKPKASPFSKMTAPAEGGEAQDEAPAEPKPSKPAGSIFSKAG